jgi:hypothetical protein
MKYKDVAYRSESCVRGISNKTAQRCTGAARHRDATIRPAGSDPCSYINLDKVAIRSNLIRLNNRL